MREIGHICPAAHAQVFCESPDKSSLTFKALFTRHASAVSHPVNSDNCEHLFA